MQPGLRAPCMSALIADRQSGRHHQNSSFYFANSLESFPGTRCLYSTCVPCRHEPNPWGNGSRQLFIPAVKPSTIPIRDTSQVINTRPGAAHLYSSKQQKPHLKFPALKHQDEVALRHHAGAHCAKPCSYPIPMRSVGRRPSRPVG